MNIKEYLNQYNLPYEVLVKKYNIDFEKIYQEELTKNWLVPIENKLNWCNDEDRWQIEKVVDKLKSSQTFDSEDLELLSTFVLKINSIVRIGNRLNNFKQGTVLDNNDKLDLVELFNQISVIESLKQFKGSLNSNLRAFLPHLFSVIKHCQDHTKYPIYYKFWKQISREVLLLNDDYDSICEFYTSFPLDNRTTKFGAYYRLIASKLIEDINFFDESNKEKVIKYLKDKVINLEEYKVLFDNSTSTTNLTENKNYWLYQPGEDARLWDSYQQEGIIGLGWDYLGDLNQYNSKEEVADKLRELEKTTSSKKNDATANWDFYKTMQVGDIIIVKKGKRKLLGYGEVISDYYYDAERDEYTNIRDVKWIKSGVWDLSFDLVLKTLTNITQYDSEISKGEKYYNYLLSIINETNKVKENKLISLLKYKKQIILQGPPGTGKTREAKILAEKLISENLSSEIIPDSINEEIIKSKCKAGLKIKSARDSYDYTIVDLLKSGIEVKATSGSNYKPTYNEIINMYANRAWEKEGFIKKGNDSYSAAIAKHIYMQFQEENQNSNTANHIKLLQFHPSYTYEDFVRGIVSKPKDEGDGVIYEAENKILGEFAQQALGNFNNSKMSNSSINLLGWVSPLFDEFINIVKEDLDVEQPYFLTEKVEIIKVTDSSFKYSGVKRWRSEFGLKFKDIIQAFVDGNNERSDIKSNVNLSKSARQDATYIKAILDNFKHYISKEPIPDFSDLTSNTILKNYVLIIDEINRANLSSVLGELIYALEYRGESVESMYAVDGENRLVLPPNLYIIGTMNTADRSVGHIDYAIRRRFAFVDVLPKDLSDQEGVKFDKDLFDQVAKLFENNLSPEFKKNEVQLGHSYFIDKSDEENGVSMSIRLEYEIKPILFEYVKDGVLIGENIEEQIDNLTSII